MARATLMVANRIVLPSVDMVRTKRLAKGKVRCTRLMKKTVVQAAQRSFNICEEPRCKQMATGRAASKSIPAKRSSSVADSKYWLSG